MGIQYLKRSLKFWLCRSFVKREDWQLTISSALVALIDMLRGRRWLSPLSIWASYISWKSISFLQSGPRWFRSAPAKNWVLSELPCVIPHNFSIESAYRPNQRWGHKFRPLPTRFKNIDMSFTTSLAYKIQPPFLTCTVGEVFNQYS